MSEAGMACVPVSSWQMTDAEIGVVPSGEIRMPYSRCVRLSNLRRRRKTATMGFED